MAALLWLGISLAAHAQTTVEYIHTDALGTPIAVTDANKVVIETTEYEPYGAQVAGPVKDGPGFTGHVQDVATGLTYMQQRYYDPQVGLFLSVDPVTAYSNPVGQFHRYRYANDNPYRFLDPDGRLAIGSSEIEARGSSCLSNPHCRFRLQDSSQSSSGAGKNDDVTEDYYKNTFRYGQGGADRLEEAGEYAAKEAGQFIVISRFGRLFGGIGRFFRVSDEAAKIAGGHAFRKHGDEFASLGIRTEKQFARHIDNVMTNPTAARSLERGRSAFWDQRTGTVVIRDPGSVDGGTAFIPRRGIDYFNDLR